MLGLRTTIYKVSDLQNAKKWYSKVFEKTPYFNESYYVGFNIKGYELGLLPEKVISVEKSNNVISYWGVENIEETYNKFLKYGAEADEKPTNVGGDIIIATVRDPWQNIIGFIFNPNF